MKYRIPITYDYVEPRKISRPNLENLFAMLQHLIRLEQPAYQGRLLGLIGQIFNEMSILYGLSPRDFISEVKLVRRWLIEFIRGGDISQGSISDERWNHSAGCPELLGGFMEVFNETFPEHRLEDSLFFFRIVYAMLCADRVVVVETAPDYSTIRAKPTTDLKSPLYPSDDEVTKALAFLGMDTVSFKERFAEYVRGFKYEVLTSRGPNGDQTWTAHLDSRAWARAPKTFPKFRSFLEESKLTGILRDLMGCIHVDGQQILPKKGLRLGKLSVIQEWGGKARIVAQLDYWTQMALTPLHNTINSFLKLLRSDGTFKQDVIAQTVKDWTRISGIEINSLDLKAATDRLPINFQETILKLLFGSESIASNWAAILVDRLYAMDNGDDILYGTGQPMGARSSFPMLALTHHVIVNIAAQRAGKKDYVDYVILGDDITMCDSLVALRYRELMSVLGVTIQESKSVLHSTYGLPAAEICKRVFVNGFEISVFNAKEIVKTVRDGSLGPTLQNTLLRGGWAPSQQVFWTFMAAILDRESLMTLVKLNCMPQEITGLSKIIKPDTKIVDLKCWFPGVNLTERDLIELHTFVVATDQLKRLDNVLKAGAALRNTVQIIAAHEANKDADAQYGRDVWINELLDQKEVDAMNKLLSQYGPLTYNHPVVRAAIAETNRISTLLHSLSSFDDNMVRAARHGLLEACRTALGQLFLDEAPRQAQQNRAVIQRMITTLTSMVHKYYDDPELKSALSVTYSVTLTSLGRLWNVYFKLGERMSVNALKASVSRTVLEASSTLSKVLSEASFTQRDEVPIATRKVESSKPSPLVVTSDVE